MLVLLAEDDIDLATTIIDYLSLQGIACDHFSNGEAALQALQQASYQCIILDWQMPRLSGIDVAKKMRAQGNDIPVLMLTARDSLDDKLSGFDAGVDDYLIKPFALAELVARIKTLSKRRSGEATLLKVADIEMQCQIKQASRAGQPLKLSPIEFQLLELLLRASPEAVSRDTIIQTIWKDEAPNSDSLKVLMHRLRKHIDNDRTQPLIQTISGFGFAIRDQHAITS